MLNVCGVCAYLSVISLKTFEISKRDLIFISKKQGSGAVARAQAILGGWSRWQKF